MPFTSFIDFVAVISHCLPFCSKLGVGDTNSDYSGIGGEGAENNILIKDAESLELGYKECRNP